MNSKVICVLSVLCFVWITGCSFIFDSSDLMTGTSEQDDFISGSDAASTEREFDPVKKEPFSEASSDQQNENPDAGIDITTSDSAAGNVEMDAGIDAGVRITGSTGDIGGTDTDDNAGKSDETCAPPNCPDIEWVEIKGGTFMMGSVEGQGRASEYPRHEVIVQAFKMSKTEVTVAQYSMCVDAGICSTPRIGPEEYINWGVTGRENYPINSADWDQASEFAQWIGGRLPSEAEWEYAARSGGLNIVYPWGNEDATCERAVILQNASENTCWNETPMEVCSKPLGNTLQGLCDMAGNVDEWLEDDWHDSYYGAPSNGQAWIDKPRSENRVVRGGSWSADPDFCRSAVRYICSSDTRGYMGFRVVLDLK